MNLPDWVKEYWALHDNPDNLQDDYDIGTSEDDLYGAYVIDGSAIDAEYLSPDQKDNLCKSFIANGLEVLELIDKYGVENLNQLTVAMEQLKNYYSVLFEQEMNRLRSR